nr:MAG: hypothetical protein [Seabass toti-like virus]WHL55072.1 MAG: hypothetical protein [Seabass toti-like virus]
MGNSLLVDLAHNMLIIYDNKDRRAWFSSEDKGDVVVKRLRRDGTLSCEYLRRDFYDAPDVIASLAKNRRVLYDIDEFEFMFWLEMEGKELTENMVHLRSDERIETTTFRIGELLMLESIERAMICKSTTPKTQEKFTYDEEDEDTLKDDNGKDKDYE